MLRFSILFIIYPVCAIGTQSGTIPVQLCLASLFPRDTFDDVEVRYISRDFVIPSGPLSRIAAHTGLTLEIRNTSHGSACQDARCTQLLTRRISVSRMIIFTDLSGITHVSLVHFLGRFNFVLRILRACWIIIILNKIVCPFV